jgi:hypothetical protein
MKLKKKSILKKETQKKNSSKSKLTPLSHNEVDEIEITPQKKKVKQIMKLKV